MTTAAATLGARKVRRPIAPSPEAIPTLAALDAELARRSLRAFVEQTWPIVDPSPFVSGWHVDAICEHLEAVSRGEIRNLLINIPPRHGKSLLVSVLWPAWEWIDHPEIRWLSASYSAALAVRDNVKCRRLLQSGWYREHWGSRFHLVGDQNAKERYENSRGGHRIAVGVGGGATGEGGDRIVVDDPHNVVEAESETIRKTALDWWDTVMATRANSQRTARVVIMQRVHESDLAGHILEQGGYEHLCLPAEYECGAKVTSIGWSDPRTEQGELLWPERMPRAEVDRLKVTMGSYAAAGQLQQRPSPAEGGIFKRHWWRFWQPAGVTLPPVNVRMPDGTVAKVEAWTLPAGLDELQSWDMAFKDLRTSDFVVGQVWGRAVANKYLLHQVRGRLDFPRTVAAVLEMTKRYPRAHLKLVEDKANGSAVLSTLRNQITGLIAVNPEGGKESRAAAVTPQVEAGNVFLPHPSIAPWVDAFIEECASFPAGKNDDQVDAMSQAINRWVRSRPGEYGPHRAYIG